MRSEIIAFEKQFEIGRKAARGIVVNTNLKPTLEEVVIVGIGGSAIPGKILKSEYRWIKLREYGDKAYNNIKVAVAISWSGNTLETINSYRLALNAGLETIAITSGGKLAELAKANGQKLVLLPNLTQYPRLAVGYMTSALFEILSPQGSFDFPLNTADLEQQGRKLANEIQNKIPLTYAPHTWCYATDFWKTSFNENTKIHAFANTFPILEHSELAGFNEKDRNKYFVIVLKDQNPDNQALNKDIDLALAILDKISYTYSIVNLSGKTLLEKVINNYVLALWTSYYLAEFLNVDPENIEVIEEFKRLKNS